MSRKKTTVPVLDPEPIRLQAAHGLTCLLYRRMPASAPVDPGATEPPSWFIDQPELDAEPPLPAEIENALANLSPEQRAALGLPPRRDEFA